MWWGNADHSWPPLINVHAAHLLWPQMCIVLFHQIILLHENITCIHSCCFLFFNKKIITKYNIRTSKSLLISITDWFSSQHSQINLIFFTRNSTKQSLKKGVIRTYFSPEFWVVKTLVFTFGCHKYPRYSLQESY